MARLKKVKPGEVPPPTAPEPFPEHVRIPEWGDLKAGDSVVVSIPGKKFRRGVYWTFSAHVTAPGGAEYIDVYERKAGDPHGLWRSFRPEQVTPLASKKKKIA